MEGSELLPLFDLYWFRRSVLRSGHLVLAGAGAAAGCGCAPAPLLISEATRLRNPLRGEVALATSSDSALLAHRTPVFSGILSGESTSKKEEEEEEEEEEEKQEEEHGEISVRGIGVTEGQGRRWWRREPARGTRRSKSLSELEFEELKGFMDLGFTFTGAEDDQRLLSIVPGLQRLGKRRASEEEGGLGAKAEAEEGGAGDSGPIPTRPYLSEAWEVVGLDDRSSRGNAYDDLLRNWRVPAPGEGVDMKEHLRCWAHAVASAVR